MLFFIKKLGSQESGYSGDTPNQRGKYILIRREAWSFFPNLSEGRLNDLVSTVFKVVDKETLAINYVYHNAKFHEYLGVDRRQHDERRLYRNKAVDDALGLDREVIVIIAKTQEKYAITSILPGDSGYSDWDKFSQANNLFNMSKEISSNNVIRALLRSFRQIDEPVQNLFSIIQDATVLISKQREQQAPIAGDPAEPLLSLFKNQSDFSQYIRTMYGNQCAVRKTKLVQNCFGLDAAHIMAHSEGGPLLPTNGILMSKDLHAAYDVGAFSLNERNEIEVHDLVDQDSTIREFDGIKIEPLPTYSLYSPYLCYIQEHRNRVFSHFKERL